MVFLLFIFIYFFFSCISAIPWRGMRAVGAPASPSSPGALPCCIPAILGAKAPGTGLEFLEALLIFFSPSARSSRYSAHVIPTAP